LPTNERRGNTHAGETLLAGEFGKGRAGQGEAPKAPLQKEIAMTPILLAVALILPPSIVYEGRTLYPYYCTKTWVCDYVSEEMYRALCQKKPCKSVK
jgi:hypothetical protein